MLFRIVLRQSSYFEWAANALHPKTPHLLLLITLLAPQATTGMLHRPLLGTLTKSRAIPLYITPATCHVPTLLLAKPWFRYLHYATLGIPKIPIPPTQNMRIMTMRITPLGKNMPATYPILPFNQRGQGNLLLWNTFPLEGSSTPLLILKCWRVTYKLQNKISPGGKISLPGYCYPQPPTPH